MSEYYNRKPTINTDGTLMFCSPEDRAHENAVAKVLGAAWNCSLHKYPPLHSIDYYASRHGRLVAQIELKCRHHLSTKYPGVFLNHRKLTALAISQAYAEMIGTIKCPSIFVVRFEDCLKWIKIDDIPPAPILIRGCSTIVKSSSDQEPIVLIPLSAMEDGPFA